MVRDSNREKCDQRGSLRLVIAVCLALLIGGALWLLRKPERGADESNEVKEHASLKPADSEPLETPPVVQRASAPSPVEEKPVPPPVAYIDPARRARILAALETLAGLTSQWESGSLDHCDMRDLRRVVRELQLTSAEICALAPEFSLRTDLGALLVCAFAFVPTPTTRECETLARLVERTRQEIHGQLEGGFGGMEARGCYAAVFALRMQRADSALSRMAVDMLTMHDPKGPRETSDLRNFAGVILSGIEGEPDPALRAGITRITHAEPEMLLTSAAWSTLVRCGTYSDFSRALNATLAKQGHAMDGLEACRDEHAIPHLAELFLSEEKGAYAKHMANSCARGLLSIGTGSALTVFEQGLLAPHGSSSEAFVWALRGSVPPRAIGGLLDISSKTRDHPVAMNLSEATQVIEKRVVHRNVPPDELKACMSGIRERLPNFAADAKALKSALMILAHSAADDDRALVRKYLGDRPELSGKEIEAVLDGV